MSERERRAHARVESDIACVVDGTARGRVRNLSLGGALLIGPVGLGEIDDTLSLEFQIGEAEPLSIFGDVVRLAEREREAEYGLQLVGVEPGQHAQLGRCIDLLLLGKGAGRRDSPRLYRRIELRCHNVQDFYATMNNISRGGLILESENPLAVGEEVTVEVLIDPLDSPFELSGVVRHTEPAGSGLHLAGLRFAPLAPAQRARLDVLLRAMLRGSRE